MADIEPPVGPLISRTVRFAEPEATTHIVRRFKKMLSPDQLFEMLGIPQPPQGTSVHILLARSHGDNGAYYTLPGGNLVEVRIEWEEAL